MIALRRKQGMKSTSLLLSLVMTVFFISGAAFTDEQTEPAVNAQEDRLKKVENVLRDWLRVHQEDRSARYRLAQILSRQGKLENAVAEYDQLLDDTSGNSDELFKQAEKMFVAGQPSRALMLLRKLRRLNPRNEDIYRQKVKVWRYLLARKRRSEKETSVSVKRETVVQPVETVSLPEQVLPEEAIDESKPGDEGSGDFMLHTIRTLRENNRLLYALQLLRQFRDMAPEHEKQYRQTLDIWRETLKREIVVGITPPIEPPVTKPEIAKPKEQLEPVPETEITYFDEEPAFVEIPEIDLLPDEKLIDRIQVAWVVLFEGRFTEAKDLYSRIVQDYPDNVEALQGLASAYRALGNYKSGMEIGKRILEIYPDDVETLVEMAIMCNYRNMNRSALRYIKQAAVIDPLRPDIQAMLYQLNTWHKRLDYDLTDLKKQLALDRGGVKAYIDLGRIPQYNDALREAREHYEAVLSEQPDDQEALLAIGNILVRQDEWDEAEANYRQALDVNPDSLEVRRALARLDSLKEPAVDTQYRIYEQDDYITSRRAYTNEIFETNKSLIYTHRLSSKTNVSVRSLQSDRRQDFVPTGQRQLHVEIDTMSLGVKRQWPNGLRSRFRLDSNRFINKGNYRYNLPGRITDHTGYVILEKDYSKQLVSVAYERDLFFDARRGSAGLSDVASIDTYTLAYDFDISPDLSALAAMDKSYFSTGFDPRSVYRLRARYRLPANEAVQLQYEYKATTRPEEQERTVFLGVRDKVTDRLFFLADYRVSWQSLVDSKVKMHTSGLLLHYYFKPDLTWYFDGSYSFERKDSRDEIFTYHTGLRIVF